MKITLETVSQELANSPRGYVRTKDLTFRHQQIIIPERLYNYLHYKSSPEFFQTAKNAIKVMIPHAELPPSHRLSIEMMLNHINIDRYHRAILKRDNDRNPYSKDFENQELGRLISIIEILINSTNMNLFRVERIEDRHYSRAFERICCYIRCKVRQLSGLEHKHSIKNCQSLDHNYRKLGNHFKKPKLPEKKTDDDN